MISAIIFDVFGTIAHIGRRTNPYRELVREGRRQGLTRTSEIMQLAMTTNEPLETLASKAGISLTLSKRQELSLALETELSSIRPYPDAMEAMTTLRRAGLKIALCSNLAYPYGPVVKRLFPDVTAYAFSYELGCLKPDPVVYQSACSQMAVRPGHCFDDGVGKVLMIGDSIKCDRDGPRAAGILGLHLERGPQGRIRDLVQFARLVLDPEQTQGEQWLNENQQAIAAYNNHVAANGLFGDGLKRF